MRVKRLDPDQLTRSVRFRWKNATVCEKTGVELYLFQKISKKIISSRLITSPFKWYVFWTKQSFLNSVNKFLNNESALRLFIYCWEFCFLKLKTKRGLSLCFIFERIWQSMNTTNIGSIITTAIWFERIIDI